MNVQVEDNRITGIIDILPSLWPKDYQLDSVCRRVDPEDFDKLKKMAEKTMETVRGLAYSNL